MTDPGVMIDKLFADLDAVQDREQQKIFDAMVDAKVRLALAEHKQANAVQPKRSAMSALAKTRYIRANGKGAYDALPW